MEESKEYLSWGRILRFKHKVIDNLQEINFANNDFILAYGNGRSYGDSCLNEGKTLFDTRKLKNFISFDESQGILECQSGVQFYEILELLKSRARKGLKKFFIPVTPGTKFITIGGAIANDVHGKNHYKMGSFGNHLISFKLLRSDNQIIECSKEENSELFFSTIGGLGLTGIILSAKIRLMEASSFYIEVEKKIFYNLDEFYKIDNDSKDKYLYTVAWLDSFSNGRGVYYRGNHSNIEKIPEYKKPITFFSKFNVKIFNQFFIKIFNIIYFRIACLTKDKKYYSDYDSFFYPLDKIKNWNIFYGKNGFYQFQFLIPYKNSSSLIEILSIIKKSNSASFLSVLKTFGGIHSRGYLSFPSEGITLALDFVNQGEKTKNLLLELEKIVIENNGKIYPAKDMLMSKNSFYNSYNKINLFKNYIDSKFSSSFWRRINNV